MASKSSLGQHKQQAEDLITCALCLGYFDDPRILPCSHTYCLRCIRQTAASNGGQFDCPLRDGTRIGTKNIDSLPINRNVRDMVDVLPSLMGANDQNREGSRRQCGNCLLEIADFWCKDCGADLCGKCCTDLHKQLVFAQHRPLSTGFKEAQQSLSRIREQGMLLKNRNNNTGTQSITRVFAALRRMIDDYEKKLKNEISSIEETNTALVESYITSLNNKQTTLSKYNEGFEKILSTKDHTHLLEADKKLTDYLEQLTKKLEELKPPVKIDYQIEGVDQLETKMKDILQQARVIEQKSGQHFNNVVLDEN
ncbi:unnamed protein product [Rotaria sp. Silwood2]|nr:unnamed protein product [Rotaria sp. Silwood2]CAF3513138.1 unnamed protein product [Rotaria sp. Silwood2]CAF4310564.1 unnamed protein product [Rotaria sp. Silwood2]CAF4736094.1 unnamed protein product [Rotaria sp. Silwood2]